MALVDFVTLPTYSLEQCAVFVFITEILLSGSFPLSIFVSFGDEVTKVSCHFQAKTVQLIFSFFIIFTKIRKTKIVMNWTIFWKKYKQAGRKFFLKSNKRSGRKYFSDLLNKQAKNLQAGWQKDLKNLIEHAPLLGTSE